MTLGIEHICAATAPPVCSTQRCKRACVHTLVCTPFHMLQCVAVRCTVLQCTALQHTATYGSKRASVCTHSYAQVCVGMCVLYVRVSVHGTDRSVYRKKFPTPSIQKKKITEGKRTICCRLCGYVCLECVGVGVYDWRKCVPCKAMLHCVAVCCSVLQCVAECCRVLQSVEESCRVLQCVAECCSVLQCVAVCCSVLQCAAVHCSALQCVAGCCRVCIMSKQCFHRFSQKKICGKKLWQG